MTRRILIDERKSFKLENVASIEVEYQLEQSEMNQLDNLIILLHDTILNKGRQPIGPIIQHVKSDQTGNMQVFFMQQANGEIANIDAPYIFRPLVHVKNCIFARYSGPPEYLNFAYQKMQIFAFEENITLNGSTYTIFISEDDSDDMQVDIFMERADGV